MDKLAEVIYALSPDVQPWNGEAYGYREAMRIDLHNAKRALAQATLLADLGVIDTDKIDTLPSQWDLVRMGKARG